MATLILNGKETTVTLCIHEISREVKIYTRPGNFTLVITYHEAEELLEILGTILR